mmetsp:Transcript_96802/g.211710  ORF Transcript_96802/g.211710 Transcript_96802/m.211710 type:complete len:111 (-) Transcript_96802:2-334(-)
MRLGRKVASCQMSAASGVDSDGSDECWRDGTQANMRVKQELSYPSKGAISISLRQDKKPPSSPRELHIVVGLAWQSSAGLSNYSLATIPADGSSRLECIDSHTSLRTNSL